VTRELWARVAKRVPPRPAVAIGIKTKREYVYCAVRTETLHIIYIYVWIYNKLLARSELHLIAVEVKRRAERCM
jgi:hypothetical protein